MHIWYTLIWTWQHFFGWRPFFEIMTRFSDGRLALSSDLLLNGKRFQVKTFGNCRQDIVDVSFGIHICHAQKTLKIAWSRKIRLKIVVIVPDLFNLDWIQKPLLFPKIDRHCLTSTVYSLYPTVNPLYTHCTEPLYHTVSHCTPLYRATVLHCTPLDSTVPTHWPALYLTVHHCTGHWPALYPTVHHCTGYWQILYTTVTHCT